MLPGILFWLVVLTDTDWHKVFNEVGPIQSNYHHMHISTFPPHYLLICLQRLLTTWVWSIRNRMKITSTWPVQLTAYFQSPTSTCLGEKGEQQQPSVTWGREPSPTKVIPMGGPSHVLPCQHKKNLCSPKYCNTCFYINNNNNDKKSRTHTKKTR